MAKRNYLECDVCGEQIPDRSTFYSFTLPLVRGRLLEKTYKWTGHEYSYEQSSKDVCNDCWNQVIVAANKLKEIKNDDSE